MTEPTFGQESARTNQSNQSGFSSVQQGTCVSVDWTTNLATINFGGGQVPMPMVGTPPVPQHTCWVGFLGTQPICLGIQARPDLGTIAGAAASGLVPVTGDDNIKYQMAYDSRVSSWTTGTRVLLYWFGGGTVLFPLSADPYTHNNLIPPPPVIPPQSTQTVTFNPTDSGTQAGSGTSGSGNYWTNQVWCSDSNIGGFFYGGQMAGIPDNATINAISIYLDEASGSGSSPTIGVHSTANKGGNLTVSSATSVAGGSGWKGLPTSFGDVLKTGAAQGLSTGHGGEHIFSQAGVNNSGAVTITWTV